MKTPYLMVMAAAACTTATVHQATLSPAPQRGTEGGRPPYTAADVRFMAGMIGHHAQARLMARWAPSQGARPAVRALGARLRRDPNVGSSVAVRAVPEPYEL